MEKDEWGRRWTGGSSDRLTLKAFLHAAEQLDRSNNEHGAQSGEKDMRGGVVRSITEWQIPAIFTEQGMVFPNLALGYRPVPMPCCATGPKYPLVREGVYHKKPNNRSQDSGSGTGHACVYPRLD